MTKKKDPKDYAKIGRPTVMTAETLNKLEQAFSIGCTDEEACVFADISRQTMYAYISENPEFSDKKEALKKKPILKAKNTVVKNLDNPDMALKYLERKCKNEFSTKVINDNNNNNFTITVASERDKKALEEL